MFEDLKANITLLERKGGITAEELLDSMSRLFDGAENADVEASDVEAYGNALVNLFDRLIPSYRKVSCLLLQMDDKDIVDVMSSCEKISSELRSVRSELATLRKEKNRYLSLQEDHKRAKRDLEQLQREIAQFDTVSDADLQAVRADITKLKVQLEEKKKSVQDKPDEYASAFASTKNAWNSLCSREDLPAVLESLEEFWKLDPAITSFSDLEQWFKNAEAGLEKSLTTYSNMYQKILHVLSSADL